MLGGEASLLGDGDINGHAANRIEDAFGSTSTQRFDLL
jgi:hypothetical protein